MRSDTLRDRRGLERMGTVVSVQRHLRREGNRVEKPSLRSSTAELFRKKLSRTVLRLQELYCSTMLNRWRLG